MKPLASLPLLAALALLPFTPLPAQEIGAAPAPVVISLSFSGGSLADLVAQIRTKEPKANIIVAEAAKDIRLPAIELRSAGLDAVLEAACAVAGGKRELRVQDFRGAGEPVYSVLAVPRADGSGDDDEGQRRTTQVHSLSHLTGGADRGIGFSATVILSSLETAMEGTGDAPTIRYHKESGLLIFRGTEEQQDIATTVVSALRDEVDRRVAERANHEAAGEGGDTPREKSPK